MAETRAQAPMLVTFFSLPSTGTGWTGNPEDPDPVDCEAGILLFPCPYPAAVVAELNGFPDESFPAARIETDAETWKYVAKRIGAPVIGVSRVRQTRDTVLWYVHQEPHDQSLETADAARFAAVLERVPQIAQFLVAHLTTTPEHPGLLLDKVCGLFPFPVTRIPAYLEAHGHDATKLSPLG